MTQRQFGWQTLLVASFGFVHWEYEKEEEQDLGQRVEWSEGVSTDGGGAEDTDGNGVGLGGISLGREAGMVAGVTTVVEGGCEGLKRTLLPPFSPRLRSSALDTPETSLGGNACFIVASSSSTVRSQGLRFCDPR